MSNTGQIKVLDTIQGSNYLAIQAALGVVQHHNLDLAQYEIIVVHDGKSVLVLFTDKERPTGNRQNLGVRPESKVELNARDLGALVSNIDQLKKLGTIQGGIFLAVQAAMGVFQRHKPDLTHYKILVVREGDSLVVMFTDKDRQAGTRGSSGARPGFEVELNSRDLRVLRSHFTR